jgi:hypothetical protein
MREFSALIVYRMNRISLVSHLVTSSLFVRVASDRLLQNAKKLVDKVFLQLLRRQECRQEVTRRFFPHHVRHSFDATSELIRMMRSVERNRSTNRNKLWEFLEKYHKVTFKKTYLFQTPVVETKIL